MGVHPLTAVLPLLRDTLVAVADECRMVITDPQGHVVGEGGGRHQFTSAAAPIRDPETGAVLGVVDLTGPARPVHPTTSALVLAAARLAEGLLRTQAAVRDARGLDEAPDALQALEARWPANETPR